MPEFNKLVESTLAIIESIVQNNMNKDELEDFLTNVGSLDLTPLLASTS